MERADTILAAVQHIHEAPLTPDGWTHALPHIAAALRSDYGLVLAQRGNRTTEFAVSFGIASEKLAGFAAATGADPAVWGIFRGAPVGRVTPTSTLIPDHEFALTTFYNEAIRPVGAFHGLCVSPLRMPPRSVHMSLWRQKGREDFDVTDIKAMEMLVPHLVTALRVSNTLVSAGLRAKWASAALDGLDAGAILVDAKARVIFTNKYADAFLAGNDGLFTDQEGVCTSSRRATSTLRRLIAGCADMKIKGGPGGSVEISRREGRRPLRIVVAPFRADSAQADTAWPVAGTPAAILMFTDPEGKQTLRREDLRCRFELTPVEAAVALEILKGDGRNAAAMRLGVAVTTVRTHLSHIFDKTGVRRQAELVRLLTQGEQQVDVRGW